MALQGGSGRSAPPPMRQAWQGACVGSAGVSPQKLAVTATVTASWSGAAAKLAWCPKGRKTSASTASALAISRDKVTAMWLLLATGHPLHSARRLSHRSFAVMRHLRHGALILPAQPATNPCDGAW